MLHLEAVNPDNWRVDLSVREDQKKFVSDTTGILARAFAYRECGSRAFFIYDEEVPVGMAMYYDIEAWRAYDFSHFFIDQRYQGKGLGYEAAALVLQEMEKDGRFDRVVLCYLEGNDAARNLYKKLGFVHTGEVDEDEIIMEKKLR
ncbi:MAG: GNAT family N-acetyltransferase [Lachnospiraceae bacterium]|nr:GNAT family N-acetyltransferase [Lachnospiraceae bacterium]